MPLRIVHAPSNRTLWETCVDRFLDELGDGRGPTAHGSYLWLTHRIQRDALYAEAAARGLDGWLAPPVAFFSELPELFEIRGRPIGLLRRRALIARLTAERGGDSGLGGPAAERVGVGQALDILFGELLPEGVEADRLEELLAGAASDDFAGRRNAWLVAVYRAYLEALAETEAYDPRSIHSLAADAVAAGRLPDALGGSQRLHIYGLTSQRHRRKLMESLAAQTAVDVTVYLPPPDRGPEGIDWAGEVEAIDGEPPGEAAVQPVPDGRREFEWIACQVKELLAAGACQAHEIALVARTGRDDTRRAHEILNAAGIPNSARLRSPLAEIPALKATLALFRAAARGWSYRALREVLASSYFRLEIDLRSIDYIATQRRVHGLAGWSEQLCRLRDRVEAAEDDWEFKREGLFAQRLVRDCQAFDEFRRHVAWLDEARDLDAWVQRTRNLLRPGPFGFRSQICTSHGERWEIVRFDQRGVERLHRLLDDWPEDAGADTGPIEPGEWYARLRRFLESNELALSTPLRTGVQVLEAHEAALYPFRHTFIVHVNDGEFPRRPPSGAIFSEEERQALAADGLPLSHRALWLVRERALWRAVTANQHVTITYRTADANGVPLLPSLTVPDHDTSREIPRARLAWPVPFNRVQARRRAAQALAERRRAGASGAPVVAEPAPLRHAVLAAHAETLRSGRADDSDPAGALNPWNGELRDPWLLDYLSERFGPDRVWSASQLESYAQCPFVYLVQRVLYLDELAEAEEETTPLTFGSVAHEVLEHFYPELLRGPFPRELDERALKLCREAAARVFAEHERDETGWLGLPAYWSVTRRDLLDRLADYLAWELPGFGDWRPHAFEHRFGEEEDDAVVIEGLDLSGERRRLRLRGRIDRIDALGAGQAARYRIVDYKSGSLPKKSGYADAVVQIPLYMKALAQRMDGAVESGCYRSIKKRAENGQAEWGDANFERALQIAFSIPARVRAGKFEAKAAKSCGWSDYWPGLDVSRVKAVFKRGESRFDG